MYEQDVQDKDIHKYIFQFMPKISSGLDHYACVAYYKNKPSLFTWGVNNCNQLGLDINIRYVNDPTVVSFFNSFIVSSICCTNYSTFVLVKKNVNDIGCSIYSFGKGNNGLLGYKKKRELPNILEEEEKKKTQKMKEQMLQQVNDPINKMVLGAFGIKKKEKKKKKKKKKNNNNNNNNNNNDDEENKANHIINRHDEKSIQNQKFIYSEDNFKNDINFQREKNIYDEYNMSGDESLLNFEADNISSIQNDDTKMDEDVYNKTINDEMNEDTHFDIDEHNNYNDEKKKEKINIYKNKENLYSDIKENDNKHDWFTPFPMKIIFPKKNTKIKFISCGDMHTLAICTSGVLYAWGYNNFGCIGNGTNQNVYEPTPIFLESPYIDSDDNNNDDNKNNDGAYKFHKKKNSIEGDRKKNVVIHCSAGSKHSLACNLEGHIYSWGYGGNGRLGVGNIKSYNKPQLIKGLRNKRILYVCAGTSHSGCIDSNYNVYTWGNGKFYKLGHGNDDIDIYYPKLLECLNHNKKICMLSFGCFNSLALNIKGDVYVWGTFNITNNYVNYYISKTPKQINTNYKCVLIHASTYACFGVTLVGDLITFGSYKNYTYTKEINDNDSDDDLIKYLINNQDEEEQYHNGYYKGIDRNKNGIISSYIQKKKDEHFDIHYIKEMRGKMYIKDILALFYKLDSMTYYQNKINKQIDTAITLNNNNNNINNYYYDSYDNMCSPYAVNMFENKKLVLKSKVKIIDGSDHFSVFLLESGKVYTAGYNKNGEIGNGEFNLKKKFGVPVLLNICVNKIIKIACGYNYVLCLSDMGLVYGWGKNDKSQLGIGVIKDFYEPVHVKKLKNVINIFAGYDHSACIINCLLDKTNMNDINNINNINNIYHTYDDNNSEQCGDLYIWGNAESGKVGLGVDYIQGCILLPRKINIINKIYKCSLGSSHSLFLTNSNELYVCGSNNNYRLGLSEKSKKGCNIVSIPTKVILHNNIYIKDILAGNTYSIILSVDGFIYIFGELIKNNNNNNNNNNYNNNNNDNIIYEIPTLYNKINNVKFIYGKYEHVFFLTYDNKLFGLGNNNNCQILCNNDKENNYIKSPKLITYFLKENNIIESVFSFQNATFIQFYNSDIFVWGYTNNYHLGIGINNNLKYLKHPTKIIKTWLTYDEKDIDYNSESSDIELNTNNIHNIHYNNYIKHFDEINLVKKKINKKELFQNDYTSLSYYEEQIENFIYNILIFNNNTIINWCYIQNLLKKEEYNNSIEYIKQFEKDIINLYSKHIEFLLNLNKYEKQFNYLYLNYQNFILSNIANMQEQHLPTILYSSSSTYIFDQNRSKLQHFIYIIQQQPIYLIILCLIHNHKHVKNFKNFKNFKNVLYGKRDYTHHDNRIDIYHNNINHKHVNNNYNIINSNYINHTYNYDQNDTLQNDSSKNIKNKYSFYKNSSNILCSFIFDLYADFRNERVRNIFTIFLIKLGIEEIKNSLNVNSIFNIETSTFFILIQMLFFKNEILINFSHCLINLNNSYSFVTLLNQMSRKVQKTNPSVNHQEISYNKNVDHTKKYIQTNSNMYGSGHNNGLLTINDAYNEHMMVNKNIHVKTSNYMDLKMDETHNNNNNNNNKINNNNDDGGGGNNNFDHIEHQSGHRPNKKKNDNGEPNITTFIDNLNDNEKDKEFSNFIKGKTQNESDKKKLFVNDISGYNSSIQYDMPNINNEHENIYQNNIAQDLQNDNLHNNNVEINFVCIFKELCKIFMNIKFPDIFKMIIKELFKYFIIYEKNINDDINQTNKIYFYQNHHIIYIPFFKLILMAIINPILKNMENIAHKFCYPIIFPHILNIRNKICDFLEILYLNKYESLNVYNLNINILSIKHIFEQTFISFTNVINNICNINEDIYVNAHTILFNYHLNRNPYYIQLKLFQVCHIFNLFFRFQNYLMLSFNDPAIDIVNFFYTYKNNMPEQKHNEVVNNLTLGTNNMDMQAKEHQMNATCMIKGDANIQRGKGGSKIVIDEDKKKIKSKGRNESLLRREKNDKLNGRFNMKEGEKMISVNNTTISVNNTTISVNNTTISGYTCQPNILNNPTSININSKHNNNMKKKMKRLIFNEDDIEFFIKSKLIYNIKLDIRFLLKEKNMSICEFTKIPMPQYICYRKKTLIENNEYLFSIIHKYNYEKNNIYIISECLKNSPILEHCIDTNNLILKLKSLKMNYMSLQDQKENNLIHLINKTIDIFLSDEMIYFELLDEFPDNLSIYKFKHQQIIQKSKMKQIYFDLLHNTYDKDSFFQVKWKNIALQISLNILRKKKHMNYLKKLYEKQEYIQDLIINYQHNIKKDILTLKKAIVFVSKLYIEKPILLHSTYFKKNIFFLELKNKKKTYFKKFFKLPYNSSTVHVYQILYLINNNILVNIHETLYTLINYLSIEIFFDLNNIIKFTLILTKDQKNNVINQHTFTAAEIYSMYNSSPYILYPFFKYNKTYLCSITGFHFMHLLHNFVIDLY
ncbi:guanidine nucleotide exchange factor [Plasmodium gaboni]|uniref:Guanidine nucleotide exchange factor n=1 Tax=Plasmodium gaboni TaxID=647221 RepID=A0A151LSZ0_9APIC|nr:guanidine nucleotide exchange factor [Plasmodium gaboni]KYO02282.1 guanidine nucleotide exchange factor [Plasmodium gaboni]